MEKFCIFCGERPESKSKEHVIPMWLIEKTGDRNRKAQFGIDFNKEPPAVREFSFDSFAFPACSQCNGRFGMLEDLAKVVVEKMLALQPLSQVELTVLLDWLDKIRVGLWLGYLYLDRNPMFIWPNFHISTRMGQTDRTVVIIRITERKAGINFIGPESPCFQGIPTCFALLINNFCLLNVAGVSICSRRLGFPYAQPRHLGDDSKLYVTTKAGTGRIVRPVQKDLVVANAVHLHQPIYQGCFELEDAGNIFDNDWVRTHSLHTEEGYGEVFLEKGDSVCGYPDGSTLDWVPDRSWKLLDLYRFVVPFVYGRLIRDLKQGADISGPERRRRMLQIMAACRRAHNAMISGLRRRVKDLKRLSG